MTDPTHDPIHDTPGPAHYPDLARDLSPQHIAPVPAAVDEAVLDMARRSISRPRRLRQLAPWAAVAAAGAITTTAWLIWPTVQQAPSSVDSQLATARPGDINADGTIDIRDAFILAKALDAQPDTAASGPTSPLRTDWDMNNDGRIDQRDVDAIAIAAVRLSPAITTPAANTGRGS